MRHYDVLLHDLRTGQIAEDENGRTSFRFFEDYRRRSPRPVLGQYFEDDLSRTYHGKRDELPAFFANLVPEGQLRELLEHSLQLSANADLALLAAVGGDLPGAVSIYAAGEDAGLFSPDEAHPEVADDEVVISDDLGLRFSLAGVQMKFSVLKEAERLYLPAHGALGDWIVKLDSRRFPQLAENEFATLEWARAAGFSVPECQVLPATALPQELAALSPEGSNVFLIRRYDREEKRRIHQEDFAQVVGLPPRLKYDHVTYEQIAVLARHTAGGDAYREVIRRLVFMIASGNIDAHLKNWSFLYPDDINPVLTPLYDQVVTIAWPDQLKLEWALKFAGTKNLYAVDATAFVRLAQRSSGDVKETLREVEESIVRIASAWNNSAAAQAMPGPHSERLREYWARQPLLKSHVHAMK